MEKGKQIIIWTGNSALPTLKFVGCKDINVLGSTLVFTYNGVSTGKTSKAVFDKRAILGYSVEVEEM